MIRTHAFRLGGMVTLIALGLALSGAAGAQSEAVMAQPVVAPAPPGPYADETRVAPVAPAAVSDAASAVHPAYGDRAPVMDPAMDYGYSDRAELSREQFMRRQRERREQMRSYRHYPGAEPGSAASQEPPFPAPPMPMEPPMPMAPPMPMEPPEAMQPPIPMEVPAAVQAPAPPQRPAAGAGMGQRPTYPGRPGYGQGGWQGRGRPYYPGGYGGGHGPTPAPYQNPWAPTPPPGAGGPQTAPSGE
jgi:hypothetical protein